MGMKLGIVVGAIVGGAVAALIKAKRAEAPGTEPTDKAAGEGEAPERAEAALAGAQQTVKAALDSVKARVNEARAAAKEAAEEKENELRRRFQDLQGKPPSR